MISFPVKVISCLFVLAACNLALSQGFSADRTSSNELSTRDESHKAQLTLEEEFESAQLPEGDIKGFSTHTVLGSDGKLKTSVNLWPGGRVPFVIDKAELKEDFKNNIFKAIDQFNQHTCVRFVARTDEDEHYVKFYFTGNGCSSYIGKRNTPQAISLQADACNTVSIIMHEMMHAIGFIHEQSRPDRDDFIDVSLENLADESKRHNFDKRYEQYADFGSEYDIHSIMQYEETAFAKPDTETMKAKNYEKLGPYNANREYLSGQFAESDIYEINKLYNCDAVEKKPVNEINEEEIFPELNLQPGESYEETVFSIDNDGNHVEVTTVTAKDLNGDITITTTTTITTFEEYIDL